MTVSKFYDVIKLRYVLFNVCTFLMRVLYNQFQNGEWFIDDNLVFTWIFDLSELALPPLHIKLPCRIGFREISELFLVKHFPLLNKVYSSGYDSIWAILNSTNLLSSMSDRVRYFKFALCFLFLSQFNQFDFNFKIHARCFIILSKSE